MSQVEVAYLKDNRPPRGPTESFKKRMRKDLADALKRSHEVSEAWLMRKDIAGRPKNSKQLKPQSSSSLSLKYHKPTMFH